MEIKIEIDQNLVDALKEQGLIIKKITKTITEGETYLNFFTGERKSDIKEDSISKATIAIAGIGFISTSPMIVVTKDPSLNLHFQYDRYDVPKFGDYFKRTLSTTESVTYCASTGAYEKAYIYKLVQTD